MADVHSYETECIAAVKRRLDSAGHQLEGHSRLIGEVFLRGSYPETQIVVSYTERGEPTEQGWPIWQMPVQQTPDKPWDPETLATIVYANMTE